VGLNDVISDVETEIQTQQQVLGDGIYDSLEEIIKLMTCFEIE